MHLTFRIDAALGRMLHQQCREDARHELHDSMALGCVNLQTSLEYKIIDALHNLDSEPHITDKVVFLHVRTAELNPNITLPSTKGL